MKTKNVWILLLCMLAGLTIGDFVGEIFSSIKYLQFFSYGQVFGLESPLAIDLGILTFSIQFHIKFTIAGILGLVLGVFTYKKI